MSDQPKVPTPRREFLGQFAASAIVLAGTACAAPATVAQTAPAPAPTSTTTPPAPLESDTPSPASPTHWDDSWFTRLTAKHKAVFEQAEIDAGAAPSYAVRYLNGIRDALAPARGDVQVVLVFRHQAVPLAFNDAMWEKYGIGEERKLKAAGGAWAIKNPVATARQSANRPNANAGADRPESNVPWFTSHGHIVLA